MTKDNDFDIKEVIELLDTKEGDSYTDIFDCFSGFPFGGGKKKRLLKKILDSKNIQNWLWNPSKEEANLTETTHQFYSLMCNPKTIQRLVGITKDREDLEYPRSSAVLLTSIYNMADELAKVEINKAKKAYNEGKLKKEKYKSVVEKNQDTIVLCEKLRDNAYDIIDLDARRTAKKANLPKKMLREIMIGIPDKEFIPSFRIGFWLSPALGIIYQYAAKDDDFAFDYRVRDIRWDVLFARIFGEDHLCDIASFILLEGVNRISKYDSVDTVKEVWTSLTRFALSILEDCAPSVKTHMLDLYVKRLEKMFANEKYEMRVNLLELDKDKYPTLVKEVGSYKDKISAILSGNSKIVNKALSEKAETF